jgi:hypothetical protein
MKQLKKSRETVQTANELETRVNCMRLSSAARNWSK